MNKMSEEPENLAQWAWQSLSELGERPALRVLSSQGEECFSYDDLMECSRKVAKFLQRKTKPQSRILLCEKPGIAFLSGLLGCFLAGRLVAPTFEAANSRTLKRFLSVYDNFKPDLVLSSSPISGIEAANLSVQNVLDKNPPPLSYDEIASGEGVLAALVQYTSGSTSDPKGVVLNGTQILHNLRAINQHLHFTRIDPPTVVSWLPPYHDLGLFSHLLSTLSVGGHLVILQPIDFIRSPYRWLKAISDYRADYSSAPDFAYRNCVKRIKAEQIADLDLSCWKAAVNAAEPINLSTLDQFYELCRPAGFKRESLMPAYGLAEATVFVSATPLNQGPLRAFFKQSAYRQSQAICAENAQERKDAIELVSSGKPIPDMEVRIVDPETYAERAPGGIGEVILKGPSVSSGYLDRADETQKSFINGYLHTGDLGFLYDGHLFITGRIKDLIILNGENFHPNDIEHLVRQTLNADRAAAFALSNESDVILCIEKNHGLDTDRLGSAAHRIYRLVLLEMGIELHKVLFVRHNSLPVTSSGKIQRRQTRALFEKSALDVVHTYDPHAEFSRLGPQDLLNLIATICDKDPLELTVQSGLADLGFDSLNLLQLDIQLEKNFNLTLNLDQVPETILDLYAQIENITQDESKDVQAVSRVEITAQDRDISIKNWQTIAKNYDDFIGFSGLLEDNPYQVIHICQRLYFFLPQKASKLLNIALRIYREHLYTNWFWYLPNFQKILRDWKTSFPADYKHLSNKLHGVEPGSVLVLAHMHGWEWIVENILYVVQEMGQDVVLIANTSVVEKLLNKKRRYMSGETRAYYSNAILDVDSPRFDVDLLKALNEGRLLIALPDTVLAGGRLTHKQVVPFMMSDMALAAGVFKLAAQKERRVYQLEYYFTANGPEMELVDLSQPHHGKSSVEKPEIMVTRFGDSIARRMDHWAQWSILTPTGKPPRITGDLKDENFFDRYGVVVLQTGNVCVLHSLPLNRNIEISKKEYELMKSSAQADILKQCRADVLSLFPDLVL